MAGDNSKSDGCGSGGGAFNLTMLMDFYEFTMANGYFEQGFADRIAYFDMFFRRVPDDGGYAIMAGVEQLIEYLNALRFNDEDIAFLKGKAVFSEGFLDYLKHFRFACDVWAVPEGMPIFPNEPIIKVRGPIIQAQLIETMMLLTINHQCLIATKANRICRAAAGRPVSEFGSRRAQGGHGALMGARAAYIGGCASTACTMAERDFGIPATGTMAHSWVQTFDTELEAFEVYARLYPDRCVFLVDTYNVIRSGVPNAIKVMRERLVPNGRRPVAIRIDSGDITYLSKIARQMLDDAGFSDCKILVSNSLDEYIIRDIISQGARIDMFGVGEKLITSRSEPVFGGVYKLAGIEGKDGRVIPKLKVSENAEKITSPGNKQVVRLYANKTGKAIADVITLDGESVDEGAPYLIFDPENTWKRKLITDFNAKPLLTPIFRGGECVYESPPLGVIRGFCAEQVDRLWEEVLRFENPQKYFVDLSQALWDLKYGMLHELSGAQK
ncbi:MAG: nicotinate phosphoribosyltransferase [Clostridiales bacterium]|jgi:nicotinate phosphoribosyltransferase|nr:nicotinate phosphoribosyltransferase [Clostridiales bacterium]